MRRRALPLVSSLLCLGLLLVSVATAQKIAERPTGELLRLGQELNRRGECFTSRYLYQEVLQREPQNVTALAGKGQALVCEGALAEGITALEQATALAPDQGETFVRLANAYLAQYDTDPETHQARLQEALTALDRAQQNGADRAAVANLRGVTFYRQNDLAQARTALENATELQEGVADYHRNLGLVYIKLGDNEAAVATLRRAVSLEPEDALGHNQLGQAYLLLDRCEDAVFELEQAVTLAPQETPINLNLGMALFDCDNMQKARSYFEKVVSLEPTAFPVAYTYLSRIDLEAEAFDSAVTQATLGAILPPTNAEGYYWLGQAYEARGGEDTDAAGNVTADTDKARDAYEQALDIDPSFGPAQEALDAAP